MLYSYWVGWILKIFLINVLKSIELKNFGMGREYVVIKFKLVVFYVIIMRI